MELTKNNIRYLDSKQILKIIIPYFDIFFKKLITWKFQKMNL